MRTTPQLREFSRAECLDRLRDVAFGRVGLSVDALPVIVPVFLTVIDDVVVFRTAPGTPLRAATGDAIVAVEVDTVDEHTGAGWTVLVRGAAHELEHGTRHEAAMSRLGEVWRDEGSGSFGTVWLDHDGHLVEVSTDLVTGQLLG